MKPNKKFKIAIVKALELYKATLRDVKPLRKSKALELLKMRNLQYGICSCLEHNCDIDTYWGKYHEIFKIFSPIKQSWGLWYRTPGNSRTKEQIMDSLKWRANKLKNIIKTFEEE